MSFRVELYVYEPDDTRLLTSFQLFENHSFPPEFEQWLRDKGCVFDEKNPLIGYVEDCEDADGDVYQRGVPAFEVNPVEIAQFMAKWCEQEYNDFVEDGGEPFKLPFSQIPDMPWSAKICELYNCSRFLQYPKLIEWMFLNKLVLPGGGADVWEYPGRTRVCKVKAF